MRAFVRAPGNWRGGVGLGSAKLSKTDFGLDFLPSPPYPHPFQGREPRVPPAPLLPFLSPLATTYHSA